MSESPVPISSELEEWGSWECGERGGSFQVELTSAKIDSGDILVSLDGNGGVLGELVACNRHQLEWRWRNGGEPIRIDLEPALGGRHQLTGIVEAIPGLILWVVDGALNDGREHSPAGWQWHLPVREWAGQVLRLGVGRAAAEIGRVWNEPLKVATAALAQRQARSETVSML